MKTNQVLLSFYQNGKWVEKVYSTNDASWREALKLLVDSHSQVKISYRQ
jgi:hypothetical protein